MRIFLTGSTGYVGSSVLEALVRAGHEVTALVRNSEKAASVEARGAHPVIGDAGRPAACAEAARGHHGFIHAAFDSSRPAEVDREFIETLVAVARESLNPKAVRPAPGAPFFLYTSGVWVLGNTRQPATEEAPLDPTPLVTWRPGHENLVLAAAGDGLRTLVVRPGLVYGGSRGIVGDLLRDAMNGLMRVVGPGDNYWPLIYDRDLADLYVRLASRPDASGVFHANDEGDERVNDIVETISAHVPVAPNVRHVPLDEARAKYGLFAVALALSQIVRSPRARALGWAPTLRSVCGNATRLLEEWRAEQ